MKKFTCGGREFEDTEELAEYIECEYDADLCDAVYRYIFELLHEYTLELTDREEKRKALFRYNLSYERI